MGLVTGAGGANAVVQVQPGMQVEAVILVDQYGCLVSFTPPGGDVLSDEACKSMWDEAQANIRDETA
jgi:hypothetical protein